MTDDIVTRLRESHGQGCKCSARCYCECACDAIWAEHYITEAADEIERLRADRDEWKQIADDLYKAACGHERPMRALNAYTKGVRDRRD